VSKRIRKSATRASRFEAEDTLTDDELLATAEAEERAMAREMVRLGYAPLGAGSFIRSPRFDE
jgi:hypothetical protein